VLCAAAGGVEDQELGTRYRAVVRRLSRQLRDRSDVRHTAANDRRLPPKWIRFRLSACGRSCFAVRFTGGGDLMALWARAGGGSAVLAAVATESQTIAVIGCAN
jgi:hypothetical protein